MTKYYLINTDFGLTLDKTIYFQKGDVQEVSFKSNQVYIGSIKIGFDVFKMFATEITFEEYKQLLLEQL